MQGVPNAVRTLIEYAKSLEYEKRPDYLLTVLLAVVALLH